MTLLIIYALIAVCFSFLCSIAEAVLLSVDTPYLAALEQDGKSSAPVLRVLKEKINEPLAVILTLNTIAHTVGAAGVGAQAAYVFGSAYEGVIYAVLTLVILVFSEIIPKAIGAQYWRQLAPATGFVLKFLVKTLYVFVFMSNRLTSWLSPDEPTKGFNRSEFTALAELGEQEGGLDPQEARVLQNLMLLGEKDIRSVMTPHSVIFSLPADALCSDFLDAERERDFTRIPLVEDLDKYIGFVLRSDVLLALANGKGDTPLRSISRELPAVLDKFSLLKAFDEYLSGRHHIKLVVNEYGDATGLLSLEDILEELIGSEIVDETDRVTDMQVLARRLFRQRNR